MPHLFCFGLGYSAQALMREVARFGWIISGTNRSGETVEGCNKVWPFDGTAVIPGEALDGVTHILVSIPPGNEGDVVIRWHDAELTRRATQVRWLGYLSTTAIYGDRGGEWVDESSALSPTTDRGRRRLEAENAWLALFVQSSLPVHIFRLAGIYGPGRNQLLSVRDGTARRIIKRGQVFSRIHRDDVAGVLQASIARPSPSRAYNVCDDEPSPPEEVVAYAAHLLGRAPPPEVSFEIAELSPMARSFYADSKRVSNRRIKRELGYRLLYPTYREGLKALLDAP